MPSRSAYRLDVGGKAEMVLLSGLVVLAVAMEPVSRMGVRGGLHQLLRNFDMAFDEYRVGAGTPPSISLRVGEDGSVMPLGRTLNSRASRSGWSCRGGGSCSQLPRLPLMTTCVCREGR